MLSGMVLLGVYRLPDRSREVWLWLREIGTWGTAMILLVHFIALLGQARSWHLTLPSFPQGSRWFYSLWKVLMAGEALNSLTPLASVGGEPG